MNETRTGLERFHPYVNIDLHRVTPMCPPCHGDCNQGDDCPARQPQPAEASTEVGAEEICRPPFSRASLAILLFTGTGMAGVIGWAVLARWAH